MPLKQLATVDHFCIGQISDESLLSLPLLSQVPIQILQESEQWVRRSGHHIRMSNDRIYHNNDYVYYHLVYVTMIIISTVTVTILQ